MDGREQLSLPLGVVSDLESKPLIIHFLDIASHSPSISWEYILRFSPRARTSETRVVNALSKFAEGELDMTGEKRKKNTRICRIHLDEMEKRRSFFFFVGLLCSINNYESLDDREN